MTADRSETGVPKPVTVSHIFGEIVWLLGQSARHSDISARDMSWLIMPPILHRQFHIFREGERPIGAAIWALLDEAGEHKVIQGLQPSGKMLEYAEWKAGDRLWLIELISPFATAQNRHVELMMADLVAGPFSDKDFKMLSRHYEGREMRVVSVPASTKDILKQRIKEIVEASI
ncbi:toxin-activating lysine-acyltransferase [Sphingobium sp. Sx8-8]|uniref:toxin-activating lysine-acyltransferase n=1 Tax=Sphingobium sp. Sx8-8 TaxID=2933617 RepID=UPI001F59AC6D|nr:toxin-activating lysine-acyltransferase [Sphingobium sp. Sx8-8]